MIVKKEIDFKEVLRRWAIGESRSKPDNFGSFEYKKIRQELKTDNFLYLSHLLNKRPYFIESLKKLNIFWYLKPINFIIKEFSKFYVVKDDGWKNYTNGTYKFLDAVNYLLKFPERNKDVYEIIQNFQNMDKDDLMGIILLSNKKGFYTIVEGHKRLVAIYKSVLIDKNINNNLKSAEFIIGITKENWEFFPY